MVKKRAAIFFSGEGSNMLSLIEQSKAEDFPLEISLLHSDNSKAPALNLLKNIDITLIVLDRKDYKSKSDYEKALLPYLLNIDVVLLAGYQTIISSYILDKFKEKILNIHPSLLPLYRGKNAVNRALKDANIITGSSVHIVTEKIDEGRIIGQALVSIEKDDNITSLHNRIKVAEHKLYGKAIKYFLENIIE